MAMTQSKVGVLNQYEGSLHRFIETGSANSSLTATVPVMGVPFRLIMAVVSYSNTPTQAGVTLSLDSGAGAGYDATLSTGTANARYTVIQGTNDLIFGSDDSIFITAPAGGVGLTASVSIYVEKL